MGRYVVVVSGRWCKVHDTKRGPIQVLYSRFQAEFVARYLNDIENGVVVPTPLR